MISDLKKRQLRIQHAFWNFDKFQYFFKMTKLERKSQQKMHFGTELHIVGPENVFGRNHNFGRNSELTEKGSHG